MLAALGDLVEDIVVRLGGPLAFATDTPATISRRRGGSAANTAAITASLGHPARFLGQVGDDAIGAALLAELHAAGVDVSCAQRSGESGTIVVLVDVDGERSMLTDRRACVDLTDPDPSWLDGVSVLHVPLYSLVGGAIADTASTLVDWAHERRVAVSIDVSSSALVESVGSDATVTLLERARPHVIFANRDEAVALSITGSIAGAVTIVKQGPDPALVDSPEHSEGPAEVAPPSRLVGVDTTGAGDAFTAGFMTSPHWHDDPVVACRAGHDAAARHLERAAAVPER